MSDAEAGGWQTIRRTPLLWAMPAAVALAALILMPVNDYLGGVAILVLNGDPQGDDYYTLMYDKMVWRYTSGFLVGTLFSFVFGAVLMTRTRLLAAGRTGIIPVFAWAFVGGAVLATVNSGVAHLAGGPRHRTYDWLGIVYEVGLFQEDGPWRVVAVWAALFPVAAVVGAGVATLWARPPTRQGLPTRY